MNFVTGDNVTWVSAAGRLNGVVGNTFLGMNAARKMVAWININTVNNKGNKYTVTLCGSDSNIKMMRLTKI